MAEPVPGERRWPNAPLFPETPDVARSLDNTFQTFDQTAGRLASSWNWAAFWFPVIWYLIKGLWAKALLMVGGVHLFYLLSNYSFVGLWMPLLFLSMYGGLFAKYDLYVWRRFGRQLW